MSEKFIGIEIGGTKLQLFVGDDAAHVLQRRRLSVDAAKQAAGIRAQIELTWAELRKEHDIAGIGVGYGGPIDWETGRVCRSHQISGWDDFPLGDWLNQVTGLRPTIDNDANCGTLAEARCGAGRGCKSVFYATLGSGLGGGLVLDGKIYHGAKPGEAEIGHVLLDRAGTTVESRCCGWAVNGIVRKAAEANSGSALAKHAAFFEEQPARALVPALGEKCPIAQRILDDLAADLAFGLSHVVHLIHPEIIVLGGGLSLMGEVLRAPVAAALSKWVMKAFAPGPRIVLAELREDMVPIGALLLAADSARAP